MEEVRVITEKRGLSGFYQFIYRYL